MITNACAWLGIRGLKYGSLRGRRSPARIDTRRGGRWAKRRAGQAIADAAVTQLSARSIGSARGR
jgi:hypothetical protein